MNRNRRSTVASPEFTPRSTSWSCRADFAALPDFRYSRYPSCEIKVLRDQASKQRAEVDAALRAEGRDPVGVYWPHTPREPFHLKGWGLLVRHIRRELGSASTDLPIRRRQSDTRLFVVENWISQTAVRERGVRNGCGRSTRNTFCG